MKITKDDFVRYEEVRESGKTNMFDVCKVEFLSGLSREKIRVIMKTYSELCKSFPGVRKV